MNKKDLSPQLKVTEERLEEALKRLLTNKPVIVKANGKLSLNKINNEAGLGHSYIHKFQEFVERAKPQIEAYNHNRDKFMATGLDIDIEATISEVDKIKGKLKKSEKQRDIYRLERNNAVEARKLLEKQLAEMTHRAYMLQEEVLNLKREYDSKNVVTQMKR
ncbi:TPA: hypothetical protein NJ328_003810 [Vibrio parahaemolyticus]|uniref:hypothetical protein n=1 Tax=Vibrio TaxID=662 RepID=UPI0005B6C32C|nr:MULTISPECIES: hypothetical protein [Vibrio]KIT42296.1 hypothetical protein H320_15895 [Vibrio parahaemolyticus 49]EGQ8734481.1 hypothetical protein [Vibrio parahaemolyticus]EGQ8886262.1 hypothetical protein [Vibrio parahaemolyticus]EGQ8917075.1 hypothetical protein [Vibrio parahaemolyticus]EGQ8936822.1 hypothetical protein [Vibrio parahaemolyticus]